MPTFHWTGPSDFKILASFLIRGSSSLHAVTSKELVELSCDHRLQ